MNVHAIEKLQAKVAKYERALDEIQSITTWRCEGCGEEDVELAVPGGHEIVYHDHYGPAVSLCGPVTMFIDPATAPDQLRRCVETAREARK